NLLGKNEDTNTNGLYCGIFAVTGATPAGVPTAPVATATTKNEGDTSGAFNANWNAVADATSYRLDVATDRKFTSILSDYNNKDVSNVTSVAVSGNNINAETTYYYRVRAVNENGQSLSSNRISTDLPLWLKNALADTDYANVEYDAETNKITFKQDVELQGTLVLPTEDATTIELGGNDITAPKGKPAVSAGNGTNVELIISNSGGEGNGGITGNGTDENGDGAPVIDFSSATGTNKIELKQTTITGSDGADGSNEGGSGGSGGAGIAAGSSTQTTVGTGSNVIGGKGGDSTEGDGGNGGAGITGGNTVVDNGGNVTGGNGGNSPVKPGEGGSAGTRDGKNGEDGKQHAHSWVYTANGNQITAYCAQTSGAQYCYHQSREHALKLTLNASDAIYSDKVYDGAKAVTAEWDAASLHVPEIRYVGTGSTIYEDSDAAPVNAGTYEASITAGDQTATAAFTIQPKSIAATDVITKIDQTSFEYTGNEITPNITVKDNTRSAALVAGTDYELSGDISKKEVCTGEAYKIVITGKGNYVGTVKKSWMIINSTSSESVEITAPTATRIIYGQSLAQSTLEGGYVTTNGSLVAGTFAWADGSVKPSVSDSDSTEYSVIFTPTSGECGLLTCTVKVQVNPKPVQLLWDSLSFTYNGTLQCPEATVVNAEVGDEVTVASVSGGQTDANTTETTQYTATATLGGADAGNYALPETAQKQYKIYPKQITDGMVSVTRTFFTSDVSDISSYLTVKDGAATLTKATHYDLAGAVSASAIGTYTVEVRGKGNYTGTVEVTYKITDSTPPTGKIKIADDEWTGLEGSITFNRFYTEKQTVTITAEDASGVKTIGYFITSSHVPQREEALRALPDSKWTAIANGGTFTLNPDNKYVIYAKITDNSGNVEFLSTDGIVVDANAPAISGIEDGKTYCSNVTFTVSDKIGIASVKIDGVEKGTGGSYSIQAGTVTKDHTIIAKDQTQNEISYTIKVNTNGTHNVSDNDWVVTTAATCENKGVKSRKCPTCGFVETDEIPKLEHVYQAVSDSDVRFVWTAQTNEAGVVTGYTATAYFKCIRDPQHVDSRVCTVTSATDENGTVYTATVTYNERVFSTQKQIEPISKNRVDSVNYENSNIYTATDVVKGAPSTSVVNLNEGTAKSLMTAEEMANYVSTEVATDVTVYLQVQNITGTTEAYNSKDHVEAQLQDLVIQAENTSDGSAVQSGTEYLDLSMYKNVKTQTKDGGQVVAQDEKLTKITNVPDKLTITVAIPSALRAVPAGYKRTYHVIRVHDNQAEVLDTTQTGNQLTFETDKFSTYAVAYVDVKDTSVTPPAESSGTGTPDIPVTKVTISSDKKSLTKKGDTLQLTVDFTPSNATDKKVTWTSSDPSVATVDDNGKVTAVGDGTVIITAKSSNGKTETITITVKTEPEEEEQKEETDTDIATDGTITFDTTFQKLRLAEAKATKNAMKLSWKQVSGADGYVLYGAQCNTKDHRYKLKAIAAIKDGAKTTYTNKRLKAGTYYKYCIRAYKLIDGKKVWLAKSKTIHVTTAGGKYGNAKAVKVSNTKVILKKGKSLVIKAQQIAENKPIKQHVNIKFESTNTKIATVTKNGRIKAKKKGTCYIYVYAQNGVYKRISVTVK
ncbi:MAG: Ig-like domain-containing protein, partial [Lachnospiraceae bacterium]|nr:Ig-like domain-containing protein [Lachnospiraceae bacterium]